MTLDTVLQWMQAHPKLVLITSIIAAFVTAYNGRERFLGTPLLWSSAFLIFGTGFYYLTTQGFEGLLLKFSEYVFFATFLIAVLTNSRIPVGPNLWG